MRTIALVAALLLAPSLAAADHTHAGGAPHAHAPAFDSPRLGPGHHAVSTSSVEAQRLFDQGLALCFAFNHDEAIRSFERAAAADPKLAMAHWGVAYALGPNINLPVDPDREMRAHDEAQKARALADGASAAERAYIDAIGRRYSDDPKADLAALDRAYREGMRDLVRQFPDDLDAQAIYAESIMDLTPWKYWTADGKPGPDTDELLAVLEGVLKRDPDHIGANHLYIHAVEASAHPERALPCAERLKTLAPDAGHLVHMPSHVWIRTGSYHDAALINTKAARVDSGYIARHAIEGVYPMLYYNHNLHFAAVAFSAEGRTSDALPYARRVGAQAAEIASTMPMAEMFVPTPLLVLVEGRRWDTIMREPAPRPEFIVVSAIWRFGRGMALAHTKRPAEAQVELDSLVALAARAPADFPWGFSTAPTVLAIPRAMLASAIADANGDGREAVRLGKQAVEAYDALAYDEPEDWYVNPRTALGGILLDQKEWKDAEIVFRSDLRLHPRNGRSLFGLMKALEGQGLGESARQVKREYERAWKHAEKPLAVADL